MNFGYTIFKNEVLICYLIHVDYQNFHSICVIYLIVYYNVHYII